MNGGCQVKVACRGTARSSDQRRQPLAGRTIYLGPSQYCCLNSTKRHTVLRCRSCGQILSQIPCREAGSGSSQRWGFQTSRSKGTSSRLVASFLRLLNWVEDRLKEFRDEEIALRTGISSQSPLPPRPMTLFRRGGEGRPAKGEQPFHRLRV